MAKYISTKTYRHLGPVAYRQWKSESHCNQIHGYALSFHLEFETDELDARNWVVDFGSLRPLKDLLEEWFDHTLLVAENDPHKADLLRLGELGIAKITMVEKTGCEGIADFLYNYINDCFLADYGYANRVWCCKVEVRETDSNMAMRVGHRLSARELLDAALADSVNAVSALSNQLIKVTDGIEKRKAMGALPPADAKHQIGDRADK